MLSSEWNGSMMDSGLGRSPTFVVGSDKQRGILEEFQRRDQQITEQMKSNKKLCFSGASFQRTHPRKAALGCKDADVALVSPMMLGVADGVSQIEDYGIDASELPRELLKACEELSLSRLSPDGDDADAQGYFGPISLMAEAYESTTCLGSTTVLLAILDNSTKIHGKCHAMIAMISIGDCELVILRRTKGRKKHMEAIFHTEMQRIDGSAQCPLQVARVDEDIDPGFDESIAVEVIKKGSAVHCVSAYAGDILVMGSDGVFDNLFVDEIVAISNELLRDSGEKPAALLEEVARRIVEASHAKTAPDEATGKYADSPIGKGGKVDDTCCVVGEVVAWTEARSQSWDSAVRHRRWNRVMSCGGQCSRPMNFDADPERPEEGEEYEDDDDTASKDLFERLGDKCSIS